MSWLAQNLGGGGSGGEVGAVDVIDPEAHLRVRLNARWRLGSRVQRRSVHDLDRRRATDARPRWSHLTTRELIRTSLVVGARYLALGVMIEYRHMSGGEHQHVRSYEEAENQLDAIYASGRLHLPFTGVLLFGY